MELGSKCPDTLFRCARGFLLLPKKFCNHSLAKELLDKGFTMNPNNDFGKHVMAQFYERNNVSYLFLSLRLTFIHFMLGKDCPLGCVPDCSKLFVGARKCHTIFGIV